MSGKREQNQQRQRARILQAASRLFAERGADAVTMAQVAGVAGVSRATVFNHFGSKSQLVTAITELVLSVYRGLVERALATADSATPELIRWLFRQMGEGVSHDPQLYRGVFREIARVRFGLDEGSPAQRALAGALSRLEALIERGQARGDLVARYPAAQLASAMDSLVNGTITHWLYDEPGSPLTKLMEQAAEIYLGSLEHRNQPGGADDGRP